MTRRRATFPALVAAAGLVVAPAAADAQSPPPAPAAGPSLHIVTERVGGARATVLAGTRFRVRVIVKPFAPGQQVVVTLHRRGRTILAKNLTVRQGRTAGQVLTGYAPKGPGQIEVRAASGALVARAARVQVLPRQVAAGSRGRSVRAMQDRLKALGYVTGRHGVNDGRTQRAVLAFRKVAGMARTSNADAAFFRAMAAGKGAFKVRYPRHGRHVEGDITHQVLALIGAGGKVERIYPMSSGTGGTPTIIGSYRVYRKDPGTNALGMVASSYFIRGYAIHGYASVPTYGASHGCMRVPIPDAYSIFNWIRMGTIVDTYHR
jgi:peptidoglycan hydrolase-like protein with peptidoglycan-binding domain